MTESMNGLDALSYIAIGVVIGVIVMAVAYLVAGHMYRKQIISQGEYLSDQRKRLKFIEGQCDMLLQCVTAEIEHSELLSADFSKYIKEAKAKHEKHIVGRFVDSPCKPAGVQP